MAPSSASRGLPLKLGAGSTRGGGAARFKGMRCCHTLSRASNSFCSSPASVGAAVRLGLVTATVRGAAVGSGAVAVLLT